MHQPERLNKVLAQLGIGSRRAADAFIEDGRVTVNGSIAKLGDRVTENDVICFDGKAIERNKPVSVLLAFNKPKGVTTTKSDPHAKVTVMDYLPAKYQYLHPIGRLDRESRGLLLFTNNGEISLKLGHPRYEHEKEYNVIAKPVKKLDQTVFRRDVEKLASEIILPEAQSRPFTVLKYSFDPTTQKTHFIFILKEGKNREIRRVLLQLGYHVTDLQRTRIETIRLDKLKEGEYREIDPNLFYE